ncbi:AraC family transcriptional regulator, partial [Pseudomonas aeruginosa]|nr:AraC family transcriptional regulator [Pseudomonas aeruginosa]
LRLALVLVDRIRLANQFASYLPSTDDRLLSPMIAALSADAGNRLSLAEWGQQLGVTERTLSRRWQSTLGMSFNDWRQRLK